MAGTEGRDLAGVPFSVFMEEALYDPAVGFYERGGQAGRSGGDFVTSPEVGPLFGAVVARALDGWWEEQGRPDPFLVDEHGAGPGTLARTVLVAAPACAPALRWTLVERSGSQRALHPPHLPHVGELRPDAPFLVQDASDSDALCAENENEDEDEDEDEDGGDDGRTRRGAQAWRGPGCGPLVASAAGPPGRPAHVVLANELLDNLPFDRFEWGAGGWFEVRAAEGGPGRHEVLVPARDEAAEVMDGLVPGPRPGARAPWQRRAAEWLARALEGLVPGGRVVVIDYASTTAELAARPEGEWLRTYRGHARGGEPLAGIGLQDITVDVCIDQLARRVGPPDVDRDQAAFLRDWGIDGLVAEGQALWAAGAGAPDLAVLRGRSRATEAAALCAPDGLGAFRVLEWVRSGGSPPG